MLNLFIKNRRYKVTKEDQCWVCRVETLGVCLFRFKDCWACVYCRHGHLRSQTVRVSDRTVECFMGGQQCLIHILLRGYFFTFPDNKRCIFTLIFNYCTTHFKWFCKIDVGCGCMQEFYFLLNKIFTLWRSSIFVLKTF